MLQVNLYQIFDKHYEWCCFAFDVSRNQARARAAEHFGEDYIDMRCKTLKNGVNVEMPTIVDSELHKEYKTVLECGFHFYSEEEIVEMIEQLESELFFWRKKGK